MMGIGHAILLSKPTGMTTSKMTNDPVDRPENIRTLSKDGRNLEVQPLIYPYMYVTLACANLGNTNITTSHGNEDGFDRHQGFAATEVSTSHQSFAENRNDYNSDYVGQHEKRERHKGGAKAAHS